MNIALEGRRIIFSTKKPVEGGKVGQFVFVEVTGTFIDSYLGTKNVNYTMIAGSGNCYTALERTCKTTIAITKYMVEDMDGNLYHIEPSQIVKFIS